MQRPTILFLHDNVRRINYGMASHHWLARAAGFQSYAVNWRNVRLTPAGTFVRGGYEAISESQRRWITTPERIEPAIIVHRHPVRAASARLVRWLARAHPGAYLSYCRSWKVLSWKWTAETCFREGGRRAVPVARPRTFLVRRGQVERRLGDAGSQGPLIFKPSTAARCIGIRISTPPTFSRVARRVRRGRWRRYVVQELAANPVLYEGHKFDLRLYAMLTSLDPLRFRLYPGGVVRVAAREFDPSRHDEGLRSLTGCSYRKRRRAPTKNLCFEELSAYLAARGYDMEVFSERAELLVGNVFRSMARHRGARMAVLRNRFYLTGLDILMVDQDGDYELLFIESNYCPQLNAWGRSVDRALREVHGEWLRDLYALSRSPPGVAPPAAPRG